MRLNDLQRTFLDNLRQGKVDLQTFVLDDSWLNNLSFVEEFNSIIDTMAETELIKEFRLRNNWQALKFYIQRMDARRGKKVCGSDFTQIIIRKEQ